MNKSALRNFAVWARRDLIKRISDRATLLGVYEDKPAKSIQAETQNGFIVNGVTFNYKKEMREAFINKVRELGYKDAIEEIAYTWFNRIVALRFMEVNGYLKNGKNGEQIYVIGSTVAGKTEPDAITYADKLSFVDKFKVYDYQDANNIDGLYRYILTKQCNDLNKVIPQMFVEIDDYIELMLPDHLLDKGAIIDKLLTDINEKDFNIIIKDEDGENASQVEIIGWLYQFYISEKKDEVFASKDQINKGTLPAVTQLFTPDWVVKYMVENSLGKMWVDGHKTSNLKSDFKYYVEEAEQTEEVKQKLNEINKEYSKKNIKEITLIDPCCGSGHILVYAFDLLYKMYKESGYFASDIPALILQNNLVGIDVDNRAAQLTAFALTMKALSYDKDFLSKQVYPIVIDIKESNNVNINEIKEFIKLARLNNHDEELVLDLMDKFQDAELYGSLIKNFNYSPEDYDGLYQQINNTIHADEFFNIIDRSCILNVKPILCLLLKQAYILSSKYDVMVTNPPYLSPSTNDKLKRFAADFYPDSKTDMFAMFMEVPLVKENGFLAMINMHSWMFLSSYESLRKKLINQKEILSMLHLGTRAFEDIGGDVVQTTAFILQNRCSGYVGNFYSLIDFNSQKGKEIAFLNKTCKTYQNTSSKFLLLPGLPIAYWAQPGVYNAFKNGQNITNFAESFQGIITGDNGKFLRYWQEISKEKIAFNYEHIEDIDLKSTYWIPYNKGGMYRKWYGNQELVVYWKNGSRDKTRGKEQFSKYYLKEYFSWSYIATTTLATRRFPKGFLWDVHGSGVFAKENYLNYLQGALGSKIGVYLLNVINPTISYQVENILQFPVIYQKDKDDKISQIIDTCVEISKTDWNHNETSWDFEKSPLI